jgi:tetratricopeptide (TPR) repeat protein
MTFDLNNPWLIGIVCGAFGAIIAGIVLYYLFEYRKEKTLKATRMTIINSADSFLEKNMNHDALEIYKSMLEIVSEGKDPEIYAHIKNNEGICYDNLAGISNKEENLTKAIKAYEEALKIYTVEKYPLYHNVVMSNMEKTKQR